MYFGKPIPEWITEHRNDTITLGEIVDYCEKSAQISNGLVKRIADGGFSHDYDLSASHVHGVRPVFKISMRNEKTRMPRKEKEKIRFVIDTESGEETK